MNPQTSTNWIPGLVVLAVGFIAAALFLLTQRRKGGPAQESVKDGALEDLERRYQSLIEQLKELAADKHSLAPERYEAERTRLEQEAVAALRARDEHQKKQGAKGPEPRTAPVTTGFLSPQLKGALWGGGIVLFFGILGYTLVSEQRARGEDDTATGRVPPGMGANGQQQPQEEDAELAQAWERLKENPSDLETAALLSHELIRRQMYEDAERVTQRGLAVDPFNVELRVHQGVLRAVRGDEAGAERELVTLVDTYPDAQESLLFLGALAMRQGNKAKALEYFERFAVEVPANLQPPPLLAAIQQLRGELGR
ncbi:tetratricopeptide repeat protein [Archangium violaceum]|uniref:tetratricopeptide repeat protein n=1 Tax=Archangium violaceum TaxID=83451 RepID=UPI0019515E89|nr:tetratricopeptide repeat protein [Archangium violaceum]QRN93575.1 tetratricopeptide repeat protein [Archangium violaceum]